MSSGSPSTEQDRRVDDHTDSGESTRVLLFMAASRDRDLLAETLGEQYAVAETTDVAQLDGDFDCCILGYDEFARHAETVQTKRETTARFVPFVLLVREGGSVTDRPDVWDYVDDVLELPVSKAALTTRIGNLIERRRTAIALEERKAELEKTVTDLELKERAIDKAPIGLTITNPTLDDNPLVYANEQFRRLTGYDETEIIGQNCRFLQGEETNPETRAAIREAITAENPVSVDIVNYRHNSQKFWNKLDIAPVRDETGTVTHFVGFQADITERKLRERRLDVLNRVLSHNLRNKMNVIEGHIELLRDQLDPGEGGFSLNAIENTAADLLWLAETVRDIERTISRSPAKEPPIALDARIQQLVSVFEDRFPQVEFRVTESTDGRCEVAVPGLMRGIEEAIENAAVHNDAEEPVVKIQVVERSAEWIDIVIEDNGPGIPEYEVEVLRTGETAISHAERLGLWLMYWVVSKVGGRFSVEGAEPRGTILTLSVPAANQAAD